LLENSLLIKTLGISKLIYSWCWLAFLLRINWLIFWELVISIFSLIVLTFCPTLFCPTLSVRIIIIILSLIFVLCWSSTLNSFLLLIQQAILLCIRCLTPLNINLSIIYLNLIRLLFRLLFLLSRIFNVTRPSNSPSLLHFPCNISFSLLFLLLYLNTFSLSYRLKWFDTLVNSFSFFKIILMQLSWSCSVARLLEIGEFGLCLLLRRIGSVLNIWLLGNRFIYWLDEKMSLVTLNITFYLRLHWRWLWRHSDQRGCSILLF
jgi:hypothetical protein